jgi:hypothetical protein
MARNKASTFEQPVESSVRAVVYDPRVVCVAFSLLAFHDHGHGKIMCVVKKQGANLVGRGYIRPLMVLRSSYYLLLNIS